jgi:aminoglycoside 3-N-acetyltransferase
MREVTSEQLCRALKTLGVSPGDGLLVHSAIQFLGRPVGGVEVYYESLCKVMDSGPTSQATEEEALAYTIAVPTFNFGFARGEPYDPKTTPSEGMGTFSEYVRQLPGTRRTPHPMQSLGVVGRYAGDLAGRDTLSAFDPGSAFERMLELDFKLLLLGADIQAVSMLHYSEQRASVPYRYWKDFTGQVKTATGWQSQTYRMFVRDLELDPLLQLHPIQKVLETRRQWKSMPLNYGEIAACLLADFVTAADGLLAEDPWSLVANRPL